METTNESTSKGTYFMITTKTDYKFTVKEVKTMLKYVYPEREEDERQNYQRDITLIVHSNVSLMVFNEENPVPINHSNKRLKMQFREQIPTSKRDAPKEVTFIDIDDPTPSEGQLRLQPTPYVHRISNQSEGRGHAGRGDMGGRGGQGGRGSRDRNKSSLKDQLPLPYP